MSKKIIALIICTFMVFGLLLSGCGSSATTATTEKNAAEAAKTETPKADAPKAESPKAEEPKAEQTKKADGKKIMAIIQHSGSDTFQQLMKKGASDTAEVLGYELLSGTFNEDPVKQQELIRNFSYQGATSLILGSNSAATVDAGVEEAHKLGMKVITIDQGPGKSKPESSVGGDDIRAGYLAGKALAEAIGGEGKVAIGTFPSPIAPSVDRVKGFKQAFQEYPKIQVIVETSSGYDTIKAMNWAAAIIQANPDIKGFITIEDTSAVGVVRAIENAKKVGRIKAACVGESRAIYGELKKGEIEVGVVAMHSYSFGSLAAFMLDELANNRPISSSVSASGVLVTKDNVDQEEAYLPK